MMRLLFVLLLAACDGSSPKPPPPPEAERGDACVVTADCADGLQCFRSSCHLVCAAHRSCEPGERCVGGVCLTAPTSCLDGVLDAGEECDDGNEADNDSCRNDCTAAVCGDAVLRADQLHPAAPGFEGCDDGNTVDDGNGCSADCRVVGTCGDGELHSLFEDCDDGNRDSFDGCSADCRRLIWSVDLGVALAAQGLTAWSFADPAVEVVAVASVDGELIVVDRLTGEVRWRYHAGAALIGPPVVANPRRLAILGSDGVVHGLRTDGLAPPSWQVTLDGVGSALAAAGAPRVWIVADGNGVLRSIGDDGSFDTTWLTSGNVEIPEGARTVPALCGDCAPLIPNTGMLRPANVILPAGETIWMVDLFDSEGPCPPYLFALDPGETVVGGLSFRGDNAFNVNASADDAYAATSAGRVLQGSFERTGPCVGELVLDWVWPAGAAPVAAPAVAQEDDDERTVIYATASALVALRVTSAEPVPSAALWTVPLDAEPAAGPTLDGERGVYLASVTGRVRAMDAEGTFRWSQDLDGVPTGAPLVQGGTLYVATTDGRLHALEAGVVDAPLDWWSRDNANNTNTSTSSNCGALPVGPAWVGVALAALARRRRSA